MKIITIVFLLFLLGCANQNKKIELPDYSSSGCSYTLEKKHLEGESMKPLLKNGQEVILMKGYFLCEKNSPQKGDIVAAVYGGNSLPLIKTIVATETDILNFTDKQMIINGIPIKNSVGEEYVFSSSELKMLKMYVNNNHLFHNVFFILGDNLTHSTDSRKFGGISKENILGKFQIDTFISQ